MNSMNSKIINTRGNIYFLKGEKRNGGSLFKYHGEFMVSKSNKKNIHLYSHPLGMELVLSNEELKEAIKASPVKGQI